MGKCRKIKTNTSTQNAILIKMLLYIALPSAVCIYIDNLQNPGWDSLHYYKNK